MRKKRGRRRKAEKKRQRAQEAMKAAYGRLIAVAQQSVAQAQRVGAALGERKGAAAEKLREQIATFVPRVEQVIEQARRRVIEGVAVPAKEKLTSLFEPHTQIVKRGKPDRDVEFGRKVKLDEVEGGIISGYTVLGEVGSDAPHLGASLDKHRKQFGKAPKVLAGNRGFWTPENEAKALSRGREPGGDPVRGESAAGAGERGKGRVVPAGVPVASGARRTDQRVEAAVRPGPLPGSRGGGVRAVGGLGSGDE